MDAHHSRRNRSELTCLSRINFLLPRCLPSFSCRCSLPRPMPSLARCALAPRLRRPRCPTIPIVSPKVCRLRSLSDARPSFRRRRLIRGRALQRFARNRRRDSNFALRVAKKRPTRPCSKLATSNLLCLVLSHRYQCPVPLLQAGHDDACDLPMCCL